MTHTSEARRLQRLHAMGILDSKGDHLFRDLAEQALCVVPGATIAAVSLVDSDRQWFKTIIGLDAKETSRAVSFCSHTIETEGSMVVEDATKDERFADNPLVVSAPAIRFYAGVKLAGGVGALCVIGRSPRRIIAGEIEKLSKIAQYVDIQLLAHGALANIGGQTQRSKP